MHARGINYLKKIGAYKNCWIGGTQKVVLSALLRYGYITAYSDICLDFLQDSTRRHKPESIAKVCQLYSSYIGYWYTVVSYDGQCCRINPKFQIITNRIKYFITFYAVLSSKSKFLKLVNLAIQLGWVQRISGRRGRYRME